MPLDTNNKPCLPTCVLLTASQEQIQLRLGPKKKKSIGWPWRTQPHFQFLSLSFFAGNHLYPIFVCTPLTPAGQEAFVYPAHADCLSACTAHSHAIWQELWIISGITRGNPYSSAAGLERCFIHIIYDILYIYLYIHTFIKWIFIQKLFVFAVHFNCSLLRKDKNTNTQ